jgi:hypothetical protein
MWFVSWESTPARVKASKRGAKLYPRGDYRSLNICVSIRTTDTPSIGVVATPDWSGETANRSSLYLPEGRS